MTALYALRRIAAAAALSLVAVLPISPPAAVAQTSETVIRLGVGPVDVATPLIYAAKAGIYKKYGVNVEVVKLANGPALASAVAGGALEIAQAATLSVVQAFAKGLPFTIIGNLAYYDAKRPDQALLISRASAIKSPKDLVGKTLATVSLEGQPALATFAWLDAYGVDRPTIKFIEVPASATLAAMEQNRVDGAPLYEPFYTAFMATGKFRVLGYPYDAIGKRYALAVLFANPKWVGEHRDAVERFLRASQEASLYVGAHENEAALLMADFTGVDPSTIGNIRHSVRGIVLNPGDVQPVIDTAAKYNFISKAFPAQEMICNCAHRR